MAAAVVGGVAHHAGKSSAENAAAEQQQSQQIADLQAQNAQLAAQQQQMAQQPQAQQAAPPRSMRLHHLPLRRLLQRLLPRRWPPRPVRMTSWRSSPSLGSSRQSGVLTEEEFEAEKAKILGS